MPQVGKRKYHEVSTCISGGQTTKGFELDGFKDAALVQYIVGLLRVNVEKVSNKNPARTKYRNGQSC